MPKVSVIVPVYGVEMYIERCAHSLMRQTLDDIEFIFINDCTPDKSIDILREIVKKYPFRLSQVRIVEFESNRGQAAVRERGIKEASGEYIIHCDSDDWMEPNCCEIIYNAAKMSNADMVIFNNWIDDGDICYNDNSYKDILLTDKNLALSSALSLKSSPYVWNKLVKKDIFDNNFVFPKNDLAEDWVMCVQFAYYSKKTICINDRLYHYFRNTNSIMRVISKEACFKKCADEYANVSLINNWLNEKGLSKQYKQELVKRKIVTKAQLMPIIDDAKARRMWRKTFSEINIPIIFCPDFRKHDRIRFFLLVTGLYWPLRQIRQHFH